MGSSQEAWAEMEAQKQKEKAEEQKTVLKAGDEFKLDGLPVQVHQIDRPRLTLNLKGGNKWNPALRGDVLQIEDHHFAVRAVSGKRIYLIEVEIKPQDQETT